METEHGTRHDRTDLDCAACGNPGITVDEDEATCPNCDESYSLVVRDDFALLEAGGWIARITVDVPDDLERSLAH